MELTPHWSFLSLHPPPCSEKTAGSDCRELHEDLRIDATLYRNQPHRHQPRLDESIRTAIRLPWVSPQAEVARLQNWSHVVVAEAIQRLPVAAVAHGLRRRNELHLLVEVVAPRDRVEAVWLSHRTVLEACLGADRRSSQQSQRSRGCEDWSRPVEVSRRRVYPVLGYQAVAVEGFAFCPVFAV